MELCRTSFQFRALGAVVNEALLSGIPVVCRMAGPRLIREGETGAIVDPADSHALLASLRKWIDRARPLDATQQDLLAAVTNGDELR